MLLRDDGYLETDDPVVAACFLGKEAKFIMWDTREPSSELYRINAIMPNGWNNHGWPIRIPAATVAEVCEYSDGHVVGYWFELILHARMGGQILADWLRTHTEDTDA